MKTNGYIFLDFLVHWSIKLENLYIELNILFSIIYASASTSFIKNVLIALTQLDLISDEYWHLEH